MLLIQKKPNESSGIFDRSDICHVLNAVCGTANGILDHVPSDRQSDAYKAGFEHALGMAAVAFGLAISNNGSRPPP